MKGKFVSSLLLIKVSIILILACNVCRGFSIKESVSAGPEWRFGFGHQVINYFKVFGPVERAKYSIESFIRPYGLLEYQNRLFRKFKYSVFLSYQRYAFKGSPFFADYGFNREYEVYQKFYFNDFRLGFGLGHEITFSKRTRLNLFINYNTHLQDFILTGFISPTWNIKINNYYTEVELQRSSQNQIQLPELGYNDNHERKFESHLNLSFVIEFDYSISAKMSLFQRTHFGFTKYAQHGYIPWSGNVFSKEDSELVLEFDRQYYLVNCIGVSYKFKRKD